jgi:hypothetical protein
MAFKIFEAKQDPQEAISYFHLLVREQYPVTRQTLAAALKVLSQSKENYVEFVEELMTMMTENPDLVSPFSTNMIIMIYGNNAEWDRLISFLQSLDTYPINRYTPEMLKQQVNRCNDASARSFMLKMSLSMTGQNQDDEE